jgi:PAS domain-containing protein
MQHANSPEGSKNDHALLMGLPTPVMVMEADQTISYINPAFEKTVGWKLGEIKGHPLDFIPEDQLLKTATGKISLINAIAFGHAYLLSALIAILPPQHRWQ